MPLFDGCTCSEVKHGLREGRMKLDLRDSEYCGRVR